MTHKKALGPAAPSPSIQVWDAAVRASPLKIEGLLQLLGRSLMFASGLHLHNVYVGAVR
eukprot:CAMPEP_0180565466 /NCGR_PEP_ID=MMETSP1037_2-20121125/5561_1 /TAXON_ID=632150 /ORGANISM="Azadinium spinosum, Strain 3D9" /LENGTH=58 /DNA_ID=CAMNT_0022582439 /DNA_START=923 /DNA_END=1100 /DNA_ORIENTATION=-